MTLADQKNLNCAMICADPSLSIMLSRCIEMAGHRSAWRCASVSEAVRQLAMKSDTTDMIILDVCVCTQALVKDIQSMLKKKPVTVLLCVRIEGDNNDIFSALANGATHVIQMDANADEQLQHKAVHVLQHYGRRSASHMKQIRTEQRRLSRSKKKQHSLIVIGASTGGPSAIVDLLQSLPFHEEVTIVLVQHLDTVFSQSMCEWMDVQTDWPVRQAEDGEELHAGEAVLLSGDRHWLLDSEMKLKKSTDDHGFFMPSIDAFMFSLISHWHQHAIGVLLTGMGHDGAVGLAAMQKRDWSTFAQEKKSSVVYGMPKAAVKMGAADHVLPPKMIAKEIERLLQRRFA